MILSLSGILTDSSTIFFPPVDQWMWMKWEIFSMIANYYHWYYHQLFLLHYHCFSIIIAVYSKIWGRLVRSRSEYFQYRVRFYGDHAIDLCRKLVGCFLVYTGSTWYISDEKLVFLNNFPWFWHDSINNNGRYSIIQKCFYYNFSNY